MDFTCDLNELLDQLDRDSRETVFVLLDQINDLVDQHGELPKFKCQWSEYHYLIYVLHCAMMSILKQEIETLALSIAYSRGDWGLPAKDMQM